MRILRIICLVLVSALALSPAGSVFAQDEQYELSLGPSDGRFDTITVPGRSKDFRLELENLGDSAIDRIAFSAEQPEGWTITFDPPRLATLVSFDSETVYASINVPEGTAAGDYFISLTADGDQASTETVDVRVQVNIPRREQAIEVRSVHPRVEAIAGSDFVFEIEFKFTGEILGDSRSFELNPTGPQGWEVFFTPQFEKEKHISAIDLKPGTVAYSDKTRVVASAPFFPLPEPGEYVISVDVVSEDLQDTIELTAEITAVYNLLLAPAGERLNTTATAGRDNFFSLSIGNLGTAPIDKVNFSSQKPEGWTIEFTPDQVDSLEALDTQTIDINIKPPPETIAGDYSITLRASGVQSTSDALNIRVTVETPTIWGWVGIGIIVIVIAGLIGVFLRFSRR
jgi:uncharacterized membrane protein